MRREVLGSLTVNIKERGSTLRERLRDRLERASRLRCPVHDQPVTSVTIHARENGWFDAQWVTCCEALEKQAVAIVKQRC